MRLLLSLFAALAGCALRAADAAQKEPLPVTAEPFHHTVFENDVVRVIDVRIPPGQRCLYHAHTLPSVVVYLTNSTNKSQTWGETDEAKFVVRTLNPGEARYAPYDTQPLTHRVTNTGENLFRVLDIELLRPKPAAPPAFAKLPAGAATQFEEKLVRLVKIPLAPGASCAIPASAQSRLLVGISGTLRAAGKNLKWAEHRFFAAQTPLTVTNAGQEKGEAVLLELN